MVLWRRAIWTLRSKRCWAIANIAWLMMGGTGTAIHSSSGAGC